MSLDVTLKRKKIVSYDDGKTFEEELDELYWANITHNLGKMAEAAGIYEALWRPYRLTPNYNKELEKDYDKEMEYEQSQTIYAKDIIPYLEKGLEKLEKNPDYYKKYDSPNNCGLYIHFLPFVKKYLDACRKFPEAIVETDR